MGQTLTKKIRNNRKSRKPKFDSGKEYFMKNGGILLEKQIALSQGQRLVAGQLKVFSYGDIEKATNYFNPDLIIASGNLRIVYKASLEDRLVAVKAPAQVKPHPNLIAHHLTEASMSMVMNHENVAKLYGCCLEVSMPILVDYSFPNGSLYDHLHLQIASCHHLGWVDHLRVATETAYALSYMHNALAKPVVHRHVDSHIILLDDSFHAKLSNFGFSVPITPGQENKWPIEGVPGYIDPEYITTKEVTEKCDVYSFGVLLLELLTRKQPFMMAEDETDLVDVFISAVEKNCMMEMIDDEVLDQATMDEIREVSQLALMCVAKKGSHRPTMIEVVMNLRKIQQGQENK